VWGWKAGYHPKKPRSAEKTLRHFKEQNHARGGGLHFAKSGKLLETGSEKEKKTERRVLKWENMYSRVKLRNLQEKGGEGIPTINLTRKGLQLEPRSPSSGGGEGRMCLERRLL